MIFPKDGPDKCAYGGYHSVLIELDKGHFLRYRIQPIKFGRESKTF
jgi:hypothetical protein